MWKHCQDKHGGQIEGKTDFKMTPLERSRNCLTRIVNEAVRIRKNEGDPKTVSMNSKLFKGTCGPMVDQLEKEEESKI